MKKSFVSKQDGLTIIEVIITLAIFVFSLITISGFLIYSYRAKDFSLSKAMNIDNARKGINGLARELREAIQSDSGTYLLESCDDFEIIFYSDIDKDIQVERIRYFLEDEKLKKGIIQPSGTPVNYDGAEDIRDISFHVLNTSTPLFLFYDQAYSGQETDLPLSTPVAGNILDEVSLVGIGMEIDVNPGRAPEILKIKSKVQLRNIKQNQ
jgi:hypothetical protein